MAQEGVRALRLPAELYARLERIGRDEGRTPEELALHLLRRSLDRYRLDTVLPPDPDTTTDAASAPTEV